MRDALSGLSFDPLPGAESYLLEAEAALGLGELTQPPTTVPQRVCIIGAGTMGVGIAVAVLKAGHHVHLMDQSSDAVGAGATRVAVRLEEGVKRGKLSVTERASHLARLTISDAAVSTDPVLKRAHVVIEAVVEDVAVKCTLFAEIGAHTPATALLATNTSSLDVNQIAAASGRSNRFVGLHFFAPADLMRLVEVVRGNQTNAQALVQARELVRSLAKVPVVVGVCDGFVGNRIYHRYTAQAYFCVEDGATPAQVDHALEEIGFAMGPFRVMDMSGLDVSYAVRKHQRARGVERTRWPLLPDRLVEAGRLGRKSGAGWYDYETPLGSSTPSFDQVLNETRRELGLTPRTVADEDIRTRCLLALALEGQAIWSEHLVERESDIDLIWRYGYGFPKSLGGPMYWARHMSPAAIREAVLGFEANAHRNL